MKRNSRQIVIDALNFQPTEYIPKDLGSHRSTGISCFVYRELVSALGLPDRLPKIFDGGQMLAIVDDDVLNALNCDVVLVDVSPNEPFFTNALENEDNWEYFDFGGRLEALIPKNKFEFITQPDGSIIEQRTGQKMATNSYVFDLPSGGQPLNYCDDLPKIDLDEFEEKFKADNLLNARQSQNIAEFLRKVRLSTDKAVHLSRSPCCSLVWAGGHAGIGVFPLLCYQDPDYVHKYNQIITDVAATNIDMLLPQITEYIDIIDLGGGDWGTQSSLIVSPQMYREFFAPYYKTLHTKVKRIAPHLKRLTHSCGAIFPILDTMIDEIGIQVVNPVQWTTNGVEGYKMWKDKTDKRLALWGGGVNSQATLPLGTIDEITTEIENVVPVLAKGGGYIFNNIHNILAEIEPEKIIQMYRTVDKLTIF